MGEQRPLCKRLGQPFYGGAPQRCDLVRGHLGVCRRYGEPMKPLEEAPS